MTTTTTGTGPDVQVQNADTGEVYPSEVRAEIERQETGSLADLLRLYRSWSDDLDQFRAELTAWREEGLLDVHMPDGPEARRRRGLLAPLAAPQPSPYHELAPANLDAEHEAAQEARRQRKAIGWTPNVPEGAGPTSILGAVELSETDKAEKVWQVRAAFRRIGEPRRVPWWERVLRVLGVGA